VKPPSLLHSGCAHIVLTFSTWCLRKLPYKKDHLLRLRLPQPLPPVARPRQRPQRRTNHAADAIRDAVRGLLRGRQQYRHQMQRCCHDEACCLCRRSRRSLQHATRLWHAHRRRLPRRWRSPAPSGSALLRLRRRRQLLLAGGADRVQRRPAEEAASTSRSSENRTERGVLGRSPRGVRGDMRIGGGSGRPRGDGDRYELVCCLWGYCCGGVCGAWPFWPARGPWPPPRGDAAARRGDRCCSAEPATAAPTSSSDPNASPPSSPPLPPPPLPPEPPLRLRESPRSRLLLERFGSGGRAAGVTTDRAAFADVRLGLSGNVGRRRTAPAAASEAPSSSCEARRVWNSSDQPMAAAVRQAPHGVAPGELSGAGMDVPGTCRMQ